ncbi:MAG: Hint domain-containing homing endonuclease, partial [Acidobacteriaceae bacterium]
MRAFKLNKLFIATALALAFGPGVRVVEAASLCGIPGASQMGMGCGGNTGTADSTLVPNVGPYVPPTSGQPPTWGGGSTIAAFFQQNAGRTVNIYNVSPYAFPYGYAYFTVDPSGTFAYAYGSGGSGYAPWRTPNYYPTTIGPVIGGVNISYALSITPDGASLYASGGTSLCGYNQLTTATYTDTSDRLLQSAAFVETNASTAPACCTCFPAGNLVLMADGEWRAIEDVLVGDLVMGADGKPAEIIGMELPLLGHRRLMQM